MRVSLLIRKGQLPLLPCSPPCEDIPRIQSSANKEKTPHHRYPQGKFLIYLFFLKGRIRQKSSIHWFIPQICNDEGCVRVMPGARSFFPGSHLAVGFEPSSTVFLGHNEGAERDVEQPGHKTAVPIWEPSACKARTFSARLPRCALKKHFLKVGNETTFG